MPVLSSQAREMVEAVSLLVVHVLWIAKPGILGTNESSITSSHKLFGFLEADGINGFIEVLADMKTVMYKVGTRDLFSGGFSKRFPHID